MNCKNCNKKFEPSIHLDLQVYCSKYCQQHSWYLKNKKCVKKRKCVFCEVPFHPSRVDQIYCSSKCRIRRGWQKTHRVKLEKKCDVCSKTFLDKLKRQRFCSLDCQKVVATKRRREFNLNKRKTNPHYKLRHNISSRILLALKKGTTKSENTIMLIGCSINDLKIHLESLFQDGMTWDNYGLWEIDHIRPCASFDLTNSNEQRACFHYSNLQPLWKEENNLKGAQWI